MGEVGYRGSRYPEDGLDVDAAGGAGAVQLEPLVQGQAGAGQKAGQGQVEAAQGLHAVPVLHLRGAGKEGTVQSEVSDPDE